MSWMDSWSRPGKSASVPPPYYITQEETQYCQTCGRIMSSKKSKQKTTNVVKYCSDRCRHRKPGPQDKRIESAIIALLDGIPDSGIESTSSASKVHKGDHRNVVTCSEIEEIVFGTRADPTKTFGRRKNRASRALGNSEGEWKSVDMEDSATSEDDEIPPEVLPARSGPLIRPPQIEAEVNGSVGGEKGWAERKAETPEELAKRQEGQRRAQEREMVRRAARRLIVFGAPMATALQTPAKSHKKTRGHGAAEAAGESGSTEIVLRKAEALMGGAVVEPSFAKGNWAIRWRDI